MKLCANKQGGFSSEPETDKEALKMKRRLLILLLVFSFGLLFHGPEAASSEKIVKVGLVGSWTGPLGAMGQASKPGALLAQKHINEEGKFIVAGQKYKLEFVEWDDRTDPKMAVAGVTKLMDQEGIKVFLGPMLSASVLAVQPITEPRKVIHVVYSMADQIIRPGIHYTLRTVSASGPAVQPILQYVVNHMGVKTVAITTENTATALTQDKAATAVLERLGAKIVGREVYEVGTTDFFTPLARLKAANPDILLIAGSNPEPNALIIKQTKEVGWPVQTVEVGGSSTGAFFEIAGKACEGHLGRTTLNKVDPGPEMIKHTGLDLSLRMKFMDGMKKFFPNTDPIVHSPQQFYDMTFLIVEAMKAGGSVEDTDRIMKALLDSKFRGVMQQYNFMPNGQARSVEIQSIIHAGGSWDIISMGKPLDAESKNWEVIPIVKVKTIKEIRAERGY
jgi:branched-chain amino acid transport system substrate-binding protein